MVRRRFLRLLGATAAGVLPLQRSVAQREDDVKVLDGIPPLAFRQGKQCTLIGSLEAVLRYHGEPYDYVELMGLSGAAFRIRIAYPSSDRLMGGRIHPGISVDASIGPHVGAVMEATGYRREVDAHVFHGEAGPEIVAARIEQEIDENRPVSAMNLQGASCWGVLAGYDAGVPLTDAKGEHQPGRYLCRTYYDPEGAAGYQRAPHFPWDVYLISKASEPLLDELATRASIERAVTLLETETGRVTGPTAWMAFYKPDYVNGIAAYDAWIEDLEDEEGVAKLSPAQFLMYWQGHAWMYDSLHDARRSAAQYLRRIAPRFGDRESRLLEEAAGTYDRFIQRMTESWDCFPFTEDGYVEPETGWWIRVQQEEFLGRQIPSYSPEWTSDMRREGTEVLRGLRAIEEEALAALREVV